MIPESLGIPIEYRIKSLIFVNSGSSHYVELPVNMHAALLCDNNGGKTSSLSALKLFLLPEVSFKKSKDKFAFKSGGEYYSDLDSYQYYFPSTESFIICDAENPKGCFCWILYRTIDYQYERVAVPRPYSDIKHLFWNSTSRKNEGTGEQQPDISVSEIKKILTSKDYRGIIFNEKQVIGEAIYSRTSIANDHTIFSLMPMAKRFSKSSVETIRALMGMAFGLGEASTSTLPMAIGSIIDGMGMSIVKNDGIFLDLDDALQEWDHLKKTDSHLSKVTSLKGNWNRLVEERKKYKSERKIVRESYSQLAGLINFELQKFEDELEESRKLAGIAESNFNEHKKKHATVLKNFHQSEASVEAGKKHVKEINDKLIKIDNVRGRLKPFCSDDDNSDSAILTALEEEISICRNEIESLQDEEARISRMGDLIKSIKQKDQEIIRQKQALEGLENGESCLEKLGRHSASILYSLNSDFETVNIDFTLEQKSKIESFTSLFTENLGSLDFCGENLRNTEFKNADKDQIKVKIQSSIVKLINEKGLFDGELNKLKKNSEMTLEQRKKKLAECQQDLRNYEEERAALKGASLIDAMLLEAEDQLASQEESAYRIESELEESKSKLSDLESTYNQTKANVQEIIPKHGEFLSLNKQMEQAANDSRGIIDHQKAISEFNSESYHSLPPALVQQKVDEVKNSLRNVISSKDKTTRYLRELMDEHLVDVDPNDRYAVDTSQKTFEQYYASLQTLFENLDRAREQYRLRLDAHNNTAATSARMIENVQSIIEQFINGINQELSSYKISNLDQVRMRADLHPQYLSMVRTFRSTGTKTDVLLSEDFYKQISYFQDAFYIRKTGKVDISKIIERVSYQFDRNGKKENIPQSNGTNCMVNAVILALLLKRMVPEDLELSFPVIFDEVGSLDEKNLPEILKVMDDHGLILFAANPSPTGVIASVLNTYHDLALFKATDSKVHGKAESIYFYGMEETLTDDDTESTNETQVLLHEVAESGD